jgi:prephenate dehydrogenase
MSSKYQNSVPEINRLVIVDLGLIGSSMATVAREQGLTRTVTGISRRTSTLELALELGVIDRAVRVLSLWLQSLSPVI